VRNEGMRGKKDWERKILFGFGLWNVNERETEERGGCVVV
jgi:hypothetical protein